MLNESKRDNLVKNLKLVTWSFNEEKIEQLMSATFLDPTDVVLEFGGCIGRNSMIISSVLNDSKNLVVLESNPEYSNVLLQNKVLNNFNCNIESAALSDVPLIQSGWVTKQGTEQEGWAPVKTITYDELQAKYNKKFNVLVIDCEGAFYNVLKAYPQILEGIDKIQLENDWQSKEDGEYVHQILKEHGFSVIYSHGEGWGHYADCFWQFLRKL
jgi:FkbM family methyltransferase